MMVPLINNIAFKMLDPSFTLQLYHISNLLDPIAAAAMATSDMATLGLEYGQGAIGSWKLAIGVEDVELVSVERRWTERLFWQSRRTATTELMHMERRILSVVQVGQQL